jgi:hypothetical protein
MHWACTHMCFESSPAYNAEVYELGKRTCAGVQYGTLITTRVATAEEV